MRHFSEFAISDKQVLASLDILANKQSSVEDYSSAFFKLGEKLSIQVNQRISINNNVVVACSTEDADWLTKGLIDNLIAQNKKLVVFWNMRSHPFENRKITIAPIVKTYSEDISKCETLIVCKSIIYSSCVVRTNLTYLIEKINPKNIIITAPVIFKNAEKALSLEFSKRISSRFQFIYFAKDDIVSDKGEVIPGIGGEVYKRLGLVDSVEKNKYVPNLVKARRL